ncbi:MULTISPECIES: hypothetical protein [Mycobacterium]|uniref:hypothetical protein n=1 Tax=Mycobacterium TaxID=1763 RepID=UPI001CDA3EB6|nr:MULTISPECIES: hypothetical protein [Mycobacterium]MCA2243593.1 hypothetical protein [Mycobacterium sp. WUMAC-067]MCA2317549.1 hypothetical protein [Mycobacterium sp. WUMAC-025]MEE3750952.1 hypothetical protein [Mycobacterium intracellulare]
MADRLDVDARLAEGRVAVEHTQTYVQACHALGYQHPDLTAHPAQIREWYASEDGLDLRALDRDCAELRAAGVVASEALRMQRAQVAELAAAWTGAGGDAAVQLLQRHCDTADAVAAELRAAAQRCESLRDNLWHLIDSKVATAIAVDDRAQTQRPAWLAAAATVAAADPRGAEDVVRRQVIPYVDNDIRDDWLNAMRSTSDGVQTSYAMVIDKAAAAPAARFEFPGDLGTSVVPAQLAPPVAAVPPRLDDPAATVAAAAPAPVAPTPVPPVPPPDWGSGLGGASGVPAGALGDLGGLGSGLGSGLGGGGLGGGLGSGGGGGLLGLAGRIVDAMGDLLGSAGDGADVFGDSPGGNAFDENPFHAEDPVNAEDTGDVAEDEAAAEPEGADPAQPVGDAGQPEATGPDQQAQPVEAPPADPTPAETPAEPPVEPAPAAAPAADPAPPAGEGSTPCEIAADQLPQAGQ